jgi:hypothetical protein
MAAADDQEPTSLGDALKQGSFGLDLRYRFELVDDAKFDDHGMASTLRTVIKYTSIPWNRVGVIVEMENVFNLGLRSEHNDAGRGGRGNEVTDRPVIADPAGTDVNQAMLWTAWGF